MSALKVFCYGLLVACVAMQLLQDSPPPGGGKLRAKSRSREEPACINAEHSLYYERCAVIPLAPSVKCHLWHLPPPSRREAFLSSTGYTFSKILLYTSFSLPLQYVFTPCKPFKNML